MEVIFTVNTNNSIPHIPMELAKAFAQTGNSIDSFKLLSPDEQQEVINYSHAIQSHQDDLGTKNAFAL